MPCLLLLRHAKAVPSDTDDHARSLAPEGWRDAAWAGHAIMAGGWAPDAALVSDARRTRETFAGVAAALPAPPTPHFEPRIYEAAAGTITALIAATPPATRCLLVVGHNPGLAEVALRLGLRGNRDARGRLAQGFPTAALAVIDIPGTAWADVATGGTLLALLHPA